MTHLIVVVPLLVASHMVTLHQPHRSTNSMGEDIQTDRNIISLQLLQYCEAKILKGE